MASKPLSPTVLERSRRGQQQQSLHWRSTGWTPLVYPASSLVSLQRMSPTDNGTVKVPDDAPHNPYFPLNEHVLLATTRELLILDGTLHSETLQVSKEQTSYRDLRRDDQSTAVGPFFLRHVHPDRFKTVPILASKRKASKEIRKRRMADHAAAGTRKKQKRCSAPSLQVATQKVRIKDVTGEVLSGTIIRRSLVFQNDDVSCPTPCPDSVRLRKVSDADTLDISPQIELVEEPLSESDLSLFVNLGRKGRLSFRCKEIPAMLTISIVTEEALRKRAFDMVVRMTRSFDDEALRLFLGYKACSLKRERLLHFLGDHLFDVSHAMFAWKQTESEMLAERKTRGHAGVQGDLSKVIQHSLFDERALKRIGGFDDSSLLPHAISIEACERKSDSWEVFAATNRGVDMLRHHKEGQAFAVGQRRRKLKSRLPPALVLPYMEEQGSRSRSSSIGTMDDDQSFKSAETSSSATDLSEITYADKSEVLQLTLKRQPGKSWGVLLAREGDLCLVDRAPSEKNSLRRGDMVLSVINNRGETLFHPPSSQQIQDRITNANCHHYQQDWFRNIVDLFKTSHELHLMVRRV